MNRRLASFVVGLPSIVALAGSAQALGSRWTRTSGAGRAAPCVLLLRQ